MMERYSASYNATVTYLVAALLLQHDQLACFEGHRRVCPQIQHLKWGNEKSWKNVIQTRKRKVAPSKKMNLTMQPKSAGSVFQVVLILRKGGKIPRKRY